MQNIIEGTWHHNTCLGLLHFCHGKCCHLLKCYGNEDAILRIFYQRHSAKLELAGNLLKFPTGFPKPKKLSVNSLNLPCNMFMPKNAIKNSQLTHHFANHSEKIVQ